ncbi:unnamed protein product [Macrosiphum euphorbiae]|uniref:Uncharacterized protein n=1 Tax=Macrosiphum euphorbiae TaxID=13131 RepID=A0AAV0Y4V0_9HEMI|nr:unnamed protein product [Macrosiphum euphorbiae]
MDYHFDLMKKIQIERHPPSRTDARKYNTTTFWCTTLTQISTCYNTRNNTPTTNTSLRMNRAEVLASCSSHINYMTRQNNKYLLTVHLYKEKLAITHGKIYSNIKHAIYTDNLNNTYIICLNENTTNISNALKIIKQLEQTATSLNLRKKTYLRALFLSEIFICLSSQLWHLPNLKPSHLLEKIIDITAVSAHFIMTAGLLHDPIFMIMTGHLGKNRNKLKKIPKPSQTFNLQNQNLYYDLYFNANNSKQNFVSKNYSDKFLKTLTLYFNDSCILDPLTPKKDWIRNLSRDFYSLNNEHIGRIMSAYTFYNYGFFIIRAPEITQFQNAAIPNEMGRLYVTHYNITPQTLTTDILLNMINITKDTIRKTKNKELKLICKKTFKF